ncbi:MAG: hypothetical protein ACE5JL_10395 [Dehalococcoidia bacterium]
MDARDWVLLVIAAAQGEALSPVQLQKSLFLIGENCREVVGRKFYKFAPYHYGPFSPTIYEDAEELESEGLITINREPWQRWVGYAATREGIGRAEELEDLLPENVADYVTEVVAWTRRLSFPQLVSTIYKRYPKYRQNSIFR